MNNQNQINISYGKGSIQLDADPSLANWHVIKPKYQESIQNLEEAFQAACDKPIGCQPLSEIIKPTDRIVIVTSDGTRPVPNQILMIQLLKILKVPIENITVLLGNGTHRKNTPQEIEEMFGDELSNSLRIMNHDAYNSNQNVLVGKTVSKGSVCVNKLYLQADKRIMLGFIEPHFFAGFSGGAKGIFPAIAGLETILHLHRAELIGHPKSTWGEIEKNPIHGEIVEMAAMCPPEFLINVTLNSEKQIVNIFTGDYNEAHRLGCEKVKETSMVSVRQKFPIVVTSNSGYPLDQNLYQTVKGISAASRIVSDGGMIFVASECIDGVPSDGNFAKLMQSCASAEAVLQSILSGRHCVIDQWQAQILATILKKADVGIYTTLQSEIIESCKLKHVSDFQSAVYERIRSLTPPVDVTVIPDGPLTIPYFQ